MPLAAADVAGNVYLHLDLSTAQPLSLGSDPATIGLAFSFFCTLTGIAAVVVPPLSRPYGGVCMRRPK